MLNKRAVELLKFSALIFIEYFCGCFKTYSRFVSYNCCCNGISEAYFVILWCIQSILLGLLRPICHVVALKSVDLVYNACLLRLTHRPHRMFIFPLVKGVFDLGLRELILVCLELLAYVLTLSMQVKRCWIRGPLIVHMVLYFFLITHLFEHNFSGCLWPIICFSICRRTSVHCRDCTSFCGMLRSSSSVMFLGSYYPGVVFLLLYRVVDCHLRERHKMITSSIRELVIAVLFTWSVNQIGLSIYLWEHLGSSSLSTLSLSNSSIVDHLLPVSQDLVARLDVFSRFNMLFNLLTR